MELRICKALSLQGGTNLTGGHRHWTSSNVDGAMEGFSMVPEVRVLLTATPIHCARALRRYQCDDLVACALQRTVDATNHRLRHAIHRMPRLAGHHSCARSHCMDQVHSRLLPELRTRLNTYMLISWFLEMLALGLPASHLALSSNAAPANAASQS